jgi:Protein of unknown function (DUF3237)
MERRGAGSAPRTGRERNQTMTANLRDSLPGALREVRTRPLFVMRLDVHPLQIIGAAPYRRVGVVPSGIFDGECLSGQVLDGGSDWQNVRSAPKVLQTRCDTRIKQRNRAMPTPPSTP